MNMQPLKTTQRVQGMTLGGLSPRMQRAIAGEMGNTTS